MYAKHKTWEDASTFKGNCAVYAENFKCNFLTVPLINLILMDCWTIQKERAFEQFIAA